MVGPIYLPPKVSIKPVVHTHGWYYLYTYTYIHNYYLPLSIQHLSCIQGFGLTTIIKERLGTNGKNSCNGVDIYLVCLGRCLDMFAGACVWLWDDDLGGFGAAGFIEEEEGGGWREKVKG